MPIPGVTVQRNNDIWVNNTLLFYFLVISLNSNDEITRTLFLGKSIKQNLISE